MCVVIDSQLNTGPECQAILRRVTERALQISLQYIAQLQRSRTFLKLFDHFSWQFCNFVINLIFNFVYFTNH